MMVNNETIALTEENMILEEIKNMEEIDMNEVENISEAEVQDVSVFVGSFIKNAKTLSNEENVKLVKLAQDGNKEAEEKILKANGKLVIYFVKKYVHLGTPYEDLFQEGICGLLTGIYKYDETKGCSFSTYVSYWIRSRIRKHAIEGSSTIRYPSHVNELIFHYKRMLIQIENNELPEMTEEEQARHLNITFDKLQKVKVWSMNITSLDKEIVGTDGEITLMDSLIADENCLPEVIALENAKKEFCQEMLNSLNEKERNVIKLRMGFDKKPMSLEEIGKEYGVSRERIRQIEIKALGKLSKKYKRKVVLFFS